MASALSGRLKWLLIIRNGTEAGIQAARQMVAGPFVATSYTEPWLLILGRRETQLPKSRSVITSHDDRIRMPGWSCEAGQSTGSTLEPMARKHTIESCLAAPNSAQGSRTEVDECSLNLAPVRMLIFWIACTTSTPRGHDKTHQLLSCSHTERLRS